MIGWVKYGKGKTQIKNICGVRFLCMFLPCGNGISEKLRAYYLARKMRETGICMVIAPQSNAAFSRAGLREIDTLPLRKALCAQIVRCFLIQKGIPLCRAVIALCGESAEKEIKAAALSLAAECKVLYLCVKSGAAELGGDLRRTVGAAPIIDPLSRAVNKADIAVFFDTQHSPECRAHAVCLPDPALEIEYGIPPEGIVPEEKLLAALYSVNARMPEIKVCSVHCAAGIP